MKSSRRILFGTVIVVVVTTLSTAVASAQSGTQGTQPGIQSDNLSIPINVSGSSPTDVNANYDTGNKITTYMQGQSNNNSSQQSANPQRKQPRQRPASNNDTGTAPTEAAPSGDNSTNPGSSSPVNYFTDPSSSGPGNSTSPGSRGPGEMKELPKTGGATVPTLSIVGIFLIAGGLLVRKALR